MSNEEVNNNPIAETKAALVTIERAIENKEIGELSSLLRTSRGIGQYELAPIIQRFIINKDDQCAHNKKILETLLPYIELNNPFPVLSDVATALYDIDLDYSQPFPALSDTAQTLVNPILYFSIVHKKDGFFSTIMQDRRIKLNLSNMYYHEQLYSALELSIIIGEKAMFESMVNDSGINLYLHIKLLDKEGGRLQHLMHRGGLGSGRQDDRLDYVRLFLKALIIRIIQQPEQMRGFFLNKQNQSLIKILGSYDNLLADILLSPEISSSGLLEPEEYAQLLKDAIHFGKNNSENSHPFYKIFSFKEESAPNFYSYFSNIPQSAINKIQTFLQESRLIPQQASTSFWNSFY